MENFDRKTTPERGRIGSLSSRGPLTAIATALVFFFVAGCASGSQATSEPETEEMEQPQPGDASDTETEPVESQPAPAPAEDTRDPGGDFPDSDDGTSNQSVEPNELDAFVQTYRKLEQLRRTYDQRLSQASSEGEARKIQEEAITAMETTVANGTLPPERFVEIANRAQTDAELNERIQDRL